MENKTMAQALDVDETRQGSSRRAKARKPRTLALMALAGSVVFGTGLLNSATPVKAASLVTTRPSAAGVNRQGDVQVPLAVHVTTTLLQGSAVPHAVAAGSLTNASGHTQGFSYVSCWTRGIQTSAYAMNGGELLWSYGMGGHWCGNGTTVSEQSNWIWQSATGPSWTYINSANWIVGWAPGVDRAYAQATFGQCIPSPWGRTCWNYQYPQLDMYIWANGGFSAWGSTW